MAMKLQSHKTKKNLMIVYERDINIDSVMNILNEEYETQLVLNGKKAIEEITICPPDLILLYMKQPEKNGRELCRRLKANECTVEIPILFISEQGEDSEKARGLVMGAEDYIHEPVSASILKARIRTHLYVKSARDQLLMQKMLQEENVRLKVLLEKLSGDAVQTGLNDLMEVPRLLAKDDNLTDRQKMILKKAESAGSKVIGNLNSSIDLYKMEDQTYKFNPVPVDLVKILYQIKKDIRNMLMAGNIGFTISIAGIPAVMTDSFEVLGEKTLFYSLLLNLIKNAVEASYEDNKVNVALENQKKENLILVHNRGIIPNEIRDSFFEKKSTYGKENREGLGTYIAHLIVLTMGGKISFTSDDEKGTTLVIRLPNQYSIAEPVQEICDDDKNANDSFRILVVDDYAMMRRLIAGFLKDLGYRNIIKVDSAVEAVKYLETEKVNLIISDYDMPGMNGIEFLQHVKKDGALCKIPFVMITGRSDQNIVSNALSLGVAQYIIKPFTANILEKKLRRIFECRLT
ncbi:MAG: response regulator [Desulfamplus sp.]|nr:response regulator [Desulfamplus sp.]